MCSAAPFLGSHLATTFLLLPRRPFEPSGRLGGTFGLRDAETESSDDTPPERRPGVALLVPPHPSRHTLHLATHTTHPAETRSWDSLIGVRRRPSPSLMTTHASQGRGQRAGHLILPTHPPVSTNPCSLNLPSPFFAGRNALRPLALTRPRASIPCCKVLLLACLACQHLMRVFHSRLEQAATLLVARG